MAFVVEYKNLVEDDESKPLTETVYRDEIWSFPLRISTSRFYLEQKVNAFDNDGWWIRTITKKKRRGGDVYFEIFNQDIAYPLSQLSVHQDWVSGNWVPFKKSRFWVHLWCDDLCMVFAKFFLWRIELIIKNLSFSSMLLSVSSFSSTIIYHNFQSG